MINYFKDCSTPQDIKSLCRELLYQFHPDRHDSSEFNKYNDITRNILEQYHAALKGKSGFTSMDTDGVEHVYTYYEELENKVIDQLNKVHGLNMDNVKIEIIGLWLWVTGTTKPYAAMLGRQGVGMTYHSKRKCWYYKPYQSRTRYSNKSLDELRFTYGSEDKTQDHQNRVSL